MRLQDKVALITGGDSGMPYATRDVKALTLGKAGGFWHIYNRFRVNGGTLTLVQDGDNCQAVLQFEYHGFNDGWLALPSNGYFEATVLNDLAPTH